MKALILTIFTAIIYVAGQCQSNGELSNESKIKEIEMLKKHFIESISNPYKEKQKEGINLPYAPDNSQLLYLVDKYHLLMISMVKDFSMEDLTNRNYLKKLQENIAVKKFQNEVYNQVKKIKEDFKKETKDALESVEN